MPTKVEKAAMYCEKSPACVIPGMAAESITREDAINNLKIQKEGFKGKLKNYIF